MDASYAAICHRTDTQCRAVVGDRHRRFAAKCISLRALDVGQRQQDLPDALALIEDIAHGSDRVAGFTILDFA